MPIVFGIVAVIGLAGAGLMGIGAAVTVKRDPQAELAAVAKRVAGGPKNPEDAERLKNDLDKAVKEYLQKAGAMSAAELASALQTALPSQTFEVHTLELPRGLKIVEIDTMLQAASYLVIKNENYVKVVNMPGMEVCDGAQVINDPTGPVLIAVGHTTGGTRRPLLKVYSLMPDAIRDQSDKSVPPIKGEGNASFAKNNKDVNIEISLYSIGVAEGAFTNSSNVAATAADESLKTTFKWDHGKFTGEIPSGSGQLAALHAVARSLKFGEIKPESKQYLSQKVQNQVIEFKSSQPFTLSKIKPPTSVRRRRAQPANNFGLFSPAASYVVELAAPEGRRGGGNWTVSNLTRTSGEVIANAQLPGQPKVMPNSMVPSVVRQNLQDDETKDDSKPENRDDKNVKDDTPMTKTPAPIVERRGEKQIPVKVDDRMPMRTVIETPKVEEKPKVEEQAKVREPSKKEQQKKEQIQTAETPKAAPKSDGTVARSKDPSIKDAPAVTPTPGFISTGSDPQVQVRRGPSGAYRTVGRLSRGEQVEIIGRRDGWYKIRANGREGFVMESLISSSKPVGEPQREANDASPQRRETSNNDRREARREERREERRQSRYSRSSSRTAHKPQQSAQPERSQPHAEEPSSFVP